jgi:hypothetical protein
LQVALVGAKSSRKWANENDGYVALFIKCCWLWNEAEACVH